MPAYEGTLTTKQDQNVHLYGDAEVAPTVEPVVFPPSTSAVTLTRCRLLLAIIRVVR
jgi:hypothetical protein